jgi:4-deoxy-L-threo-5-hexosulose-uronate ketol-isomerase
MHSLADAQRTPKLSSDELRANFLMTNLFVAGTMALEHIDLDRVVVGGAVPTSQSLTLSAPPSLRAEYFTERRELGVLNIGGPGVIRVDGQRYALGARDMLYVGRGSKDVTFSSDDATRPARYYLVSYPARDRRSTTLIAAADADVTDLGTSDRANQRRLAKYIHPARVETSQLVMGITTLAPGSVWNTMPSHTHSRRTEVYLYFDLPDDAVVVHLMGEPTETRHLIVRNEQVVLSPHWSIHSGGGTSNYAFCWAMGGENQDFTDMQPVDMKELK